MCILPQDYLTTGAGLVYEREGFIETFGNPKTFWFAQITVVYVYIHRERTASIVDAYAPIKRDAPVNGKKKIKIFPRFLFTANPLFGRDTHVKYLNLDTIRRSRETRLRHTDQRKSIYHFALFSANANTLKYDTHARAHAFRGIFFSVVTTYNARIARPPAVAIAMVSPIAIAAVMVPLDS